MRNGAWTFLIAIGLNAGCGGATAPGPGPSAASAEDPLASEPGASVAPDADDATSARGADTVSAAVGELDQPAPANKEVPEVPPESEAGTDPCQKSGAKLALTVDREQVKLEEGRLEARMDGPICSLLLRITRKDGLPSIEKTFRYTGPERELDWDPIPREQIEKIEVRISSDDGGYQSVFLVPWSVSIDHKEVEFDTNQSVIRESEVASLEESYRKIEEVLRKVEDKGLGTITLFIAGHTDTRGSDEHNMTLSRNRARAIADWFMKRGLCVPIAYEGFGETALKKKTADEVDEQANRRVDYILAVEPPMTKNGASPAWKAVSQGC